jgi:SAM-dependent methyltransferase
MLQAATATEGHDHREHLASSFCCALARQCFINDYVFCCADDEWARAQRLRDRLEAALWFGETVPASWLVVVAAYFPLSSVACSEALPARPWPGCVAALLAQQVVEPREEAGYRAGMPQLTAVEDGISRLVQRQYEEHPYPRWIKAAPIAPALSLDAYVRQQFPFAPFEPGATGSASDILIAGCGTGQESIEMAQRFPRAQVLAVDLSLSSLCYAKRKTRELGLGNVQYAQGDILDLGSAGRTFDLVASVGVLHHLADPAAGLQRLLSLLRPGGLMRLGLYSERARQVVVFARHFIAEHGYTSSAADIRRCRQDLMSAQNATRFKQLTLYNDFFVTGECRDLLFHVQEHRFTLPQIKAMLAGFGLQFIGFALRPHVIRTYRERFPADRTLASLDCWNDFECEFPDTFAGMYLFWVRKPGGPWTSGDAA